MIKMEGHAGHMYHTLAWVMVVFALECTESTLFGCEAFMEAKSLGMFYV